MPLPMELRTDTSHKENVPPRPANPLKPDQQRFLKRLGKGPGSGRGRWGSPGAALPVQTNLASSHLGRALTDTTSRLVNSSFRQQSNLQPLARRPQRRAREFAVQQSNLSMSGTGLAEHGNHSSPHFWPEPGESLGPYTLGWGSPLHSQPLVRLTPSLQWLPLPAADTPCPELRPVAGFGSLEGSPRPGPRSCGGLISGPKGQSLTLEDLAVPAQSQPQALLQAAIHQLLVSLQCLEHQVARLGRRVSQKPLGPARRDPQNNHGQALPACPQPRQPALASWGARKRPLRGLRDPADIPETHGVPADSESNREPVLPGATLGMLPGEPLGPEQGGIPADPLSQGENSSGPTYVGGQRGLPRLPGGAGSREARLCASPSPPAARGVPPGQEGGQGALQEQTDRKEEKTASWPPEATPAPGALQNKARNMETLEMDTARWQLLSGCFRAWWHLVQRQWMVEKAEALRHWHLLHKGLQVLRGAQRLREAQLEAAQQRHTKALLARSFREWKDLAAWRKQGQSQIQPRPGPPASWGGQGQGPLERKPVGDPAQRNSLGRLREEEGAPQIPGWRPDSRDGRDQILQALQQLAAFLLWCHQKGWARQERGFIEKAAPTSPRTQRMEPPPQAWRTRAAHTACVALLGTWCQRAWLRRCFAAWQRFVQRGAQYQDHLADHQVGTLRMCLRQWVQMKQLQASDAAKVTQLSLCRQKAGTMALLSSAPGAATAHNPRLETQAQGLPQGQGRGSLQEACRRLALQRALLLWRMRLSQRQRADSFFQGMQQRTLQRVLRQWHWRTQLQCPPSGGVQITSVPEPLGSVRGREASLGCSIPYGLLERAPRDPTLRETLRVTYLQAAGRQQQGQCLLRAGQSQGAAKWYQRTLQRCVLLSWSHWAAAQGARRELAARWAWCRSCRAALGVWRQQLAQWREAEHCARERSRILARVSLRHWHSCWQRQQSLREKYQPWAQVHLQGLLRAEFRSWQWAAAHQRHRAAGQERLLLQRVLEAWAQAVAQGHVQRAAIAQLWQAGCRRLLQTHWAQWQAVLLRVRLELRAPAEAAQEAMGTCTICPGPGPDLRHCPGMATRGQPLLLMDASAPGKQTGSCWTQALGLVAPRPPRLHGLSRQQTQREPSWAQSETEQDFRLPPARCQPPLHQAFGLWLRWPVRCDWAWGPPLCMRTGRNCSAETRALQGQAEAHQRQLGRKYLQRWRLERLLHRLQGPQQARVLAATWQCWVDAQETEQLAQTLLRQWHLGWAWGAWRRRVLQLRVAQQVQQQNDGCVLSQAFEKWQERSHRQPEAPEQAGYQGPREQAGSCQCPGYGEAGMGQGAQLQLLTCSQRKKAELSPAFHGRPPCECRCSSHGVLTEGTVPS